MVKEGRGRVEEMGTCSLCVAVGEVFTLLSWVTRLWRESSSHAAGLPGAEGSRAGQPLDESGLHGTMGRRRLALAWHADGDQRVGWLWFAYD